LRGEIQARIAYVGDSLTAGSLSSSNYTTAYVGRLRRHFNSIQQGAYAAEDSGNLIVTDATADLTATTGSYGTDGPLKQSLVLAVGQTLTFSGNYQFIDFMYERSPGAGSAEIRRDGVLVATKVMAGAAGSNIVTYNATAVSTVQKNSVWTITASVATIKITGLIRRHVNVGSFLTVSRIAKGGYASSDFVTAPQTASIKAFSTYDGLTPIYVLALGTNDIYNAGKAISSAAFMANLETIILALNAGIQYCVLTVPPIPNEAVYPPILEPHANYKAKILALALKYNLPVIDYSITDWAGLGLYADNLHWSDGGHSLVASKHLKYFGVSSSVEKIYSNEDCTFAGTWTSFSAGSQVRLISNGNDAELSGIILAGVGPTTALGSFTGPGLPSGRDVFFEAVTDTNTIVTIRLTQGGVFSISGGVTPLAAGYIHLSGKKFKIRDNIY
jgi:lysophospholipase L1-like esterase